MLRTRVISAIILVAIIAGPVLLGGLLFWLLITLVALLAAWELAGLFHRSDRYHPSVPLCLLLAVLLASQAQWPDLLPLPWILAAIVPGSLLLSLWRQSPEPATDWALSLACALYPGLMLGYFIQLRALDQGLWWLLVGALSVMAADVAAYFGGRAFGQHLWWPRHSPKKTWEGYLSGVAGSVVVSSALGVWWLSLPLVEATLLGLLIGTIAPLGDLAESMIKRQAGAKDSSTLIPGHGGILDRIDSLLIGVPLTFFWATIFTA